MRASTTTPFAVTSLPSLSRAGEELAVVVAAARYDWPRVRDDPPILSEQQQPPELGDRYYGDPASSSLRWEGQSTYLRPATDVYVRGHAWTPGGRPGPVAEVYVMVGPYERRAVVFGDRVWVQTGNELLPSRPAAFDRMPLIYERSFGGVPPEPSPRVLELAAHNPVGRGLYRRARDARGQPLPNIEDPAQPLRRFGDRPRPHGFGPIARHWLPRRRYAGSYDQAWLDTRAPLWPADMDERLFCAASPGASVTPHLRGGELVVVAGLTPEGPARFALPRVELEASFEFRRRVERRPMVLDAVDVDGDARCVTLIWRASVAAGDELIELLATRVDLREEAPPR